VLGLTRIGWVVLGYAVLVGLGEPGLDWARLVWVM
jgi:hypothetical protein